MHKLIYIVEDDKDISELLVYNLKNENFEVRSFENGIDLLVAIKERIPDLIIADIMLPDIDGFSILKLVKLESSIKNVPIILLTAKNNEIDKVLGLELGADDYITKPFSIRELLIRIKNLLKKCQEPIETNHDVIQIEDLKIYPDIFKVEIGNKYIPLTISEFKILLSLAKNPERIFSRQYLMKNVLNSETNLSSRVIDVHIKRLRDKLGKYGKYIKTVRGLGYKFEK